MIIDLMTFWHWPQKSRFDDFLALVPEVEKSKISCAITLGRYTSWNTECEGDTVFCFLFTTPTFSTLAMGRRSLTDQSGGPRTHDTTHRNMIK